VAIRRRGLESVAVEPPPQRPPVPHEYIRGGGYYDKKEMETDDDTEPQP
jgi:hypothetical protein